MREIKFRAWDTRKPQMLPADIVAVMPVADGVSPLSISGEAIRIRPDNEQFVLMQYTGLTDKHGVEIYEGDILLRARVYIEKIIWDKGSFHAEHEYIFNSPHWGRGQVYDNLKYWKQQGVEVIGNIYENPELLEVR